MASRKKADEDKLRRRRLARFRFKTLVRVVICNRYWIAEIEDQEIGNSVNRNLAVIDRRLTHKGTLTIIEKKILNSTPQERTEDGRRMLTVVFRKIECMREFTEAQLNELAGCATFQYWEPGRVVLREGHQPHAVYFVSNGEVVVSRLQWDSIYKIHTDEPCGKRVRGQMFGEIALLDECVRTATCTTATDCELLCVARADFDRILKRTLLDRWAQTRRALERFDYFKHWSAEQVRECCALSGIVEYEPQQQLPVADDDGDRRMYAHFVLSGQCMILQCLTVVREVPPGDRYRLLPIADDRRASNGDVTNAANRPGGNGAVEEHRFMDVGTFSCGAAFGLGEAMQHRMVVARTRVQCLTIPRDWLFERRQNVGNTWQRVRMQLDMTVPSRDRLFELFVQEQRWRRYRTELVEDFVRRNPRQNPTRLADVPVMCRVEEGDLE